MLSAERGPKGKDALNYVGFYSATAIYEPGDTVLVDPDSMQLWRALIRPPMGKGPWSFADDAAHTPYWTPQSYPVNDTEELFVSVRGTFTANSEVFRRRFARSGKFKPLFRGAVAYCDAAPTNEARFKIVVGQAVAGSSGVTVGEVIFAAGAKVGTVSMVANANLGISAGGSSTSSRPRRSTRPSAGWRLPSPTTSSERRSEGPPDSIGSTYAPSYRDLVKVRRVVLALLH